MLKVLAPFIRAGAFLRTELAEILRQPRLILGLVLSPFLILLLVGVGFQNEAPVYRTELVIPSDSPFAQTMQELGTEISPQIDIQRVGSDLELALGRLRRGDLDLVIEVPADPMAQLQEHQQSTFVFYNAMVDPAETAYVDYFAQVYASEVNRRLLSLVARQLSNQEIAEALVIELGTVKNHVHSILQKLELQTRHQAADYLLSLESSDLA